MSRVSLTAVADHRCFSKRCCWNWDEKGKNNGFAKNSERIHNKRKFNFLTLSSSALVMRGSSSFPKFYEEVLKDARQKFTREISFQSKDKDISPAKALLYVAAEDEAFMAANREVDARSLQNEREDNLFSSDALQWKSLEEMPLAGKTINDWLIELDAIAEEIKAKLVPRDIGCHLAEVLEAENIVLFNSRGFQSSFSLVDPNCSYLHSVLRSGHGSAILLGIIYIKVCRRLNLTIVGSQVGEEFLVWPQMENPEVLFKVTSGNNLYGVVNGKWVDNPKMAPSLRSRLFSGLDIATN